MANITKWSPLRDLSGLQDEMNELFRDFFKGTPRSAEIGEGMWSPAVDIEEADDGFTVTADLPGMSQKDIKISLESNVLSIQGERKFEKTEKKRGVQRIERAYGAFARSFSLPASVDSEGVKAVYKNGVLTVTVPKKEGSKPRQIEISA